MIRLIPPVAVPAGGASIAGSVFSGSEDALRERLLLDSGHSELAFFPSGRAALAHVLARFRSDGRDRVVVPAYTCWSVAASIVRAGMKIRLADVDPSTLDYRAGALEAACDDRTAAVVAAQLFARTADVTRVARAAAACGARWIDDAAQALPAQPSGADATVVSFGRGKPLALGGGGALLSSSAGGAEARPRAGGLVAALKLGVTAMLGRPAWYRLPRSLPFLAIGTTVYDPGFAADGPFYRWQSRLGARLTENWDETVGRRTAHARRLLAAIEGCAGWSVPAAAAVAHGPLRLPVLAPDRATRDLVRARLLRMGVDASAMYPATLSGIAGIAEHLAAAVETPGADALVERLLTLPTYPTMAEADARRVEDAFVTAAGAAR